MIGHTVSHYKVIERLGEGGMGIVYKAHDTKLDRMVALKFLPENLSPTESDKKRLINEAKAAATLNHQNICTIHEIYEHENQLFIVMEYIEGQTLRDRIRKRKTVPISVKQAIDIGIQIAEGLAAAHGNGIIHRDVKPENIMLKKDGRIVIMDFGLAKHRGVSGLSKEGTTLGTLGYMAPEQVQGLDLDHRADIFSFGVLLYELISGEPPFKGDHEVAVAYEIVNVDPPLLTKINPYIDSELDRIIFECLYKDKDERYQSTLEIAKDLKRYKRESGSQKGTGVPTVNNVAVRSTVAKQFRRTRDGENEGVIPAYNSINRSVLIGVGAVIVILIVSILWLILLRQQPEDVQKIRSYIVPEPGTQLHSTSLAGGQVAISPDGGLIVYTASNAEGKNVLWIRPLAEPYARQLSGTENAVYPFWSSDSKNVGFFADNKLKYVTVSSGLLVDVADIITGRGGTWNAHGVILFAPALNAPIYMVSASGGTPKPVTVLDTLGGESTHRWPWFLPDGKHFLYFVGERVDQPTDSDGVYIGSLDSKVKKKILQNTMQAIYASGHILFVRGKLLMAQPFNSKRLEFTGNPFPVTDNVGVDVTYNLSLFTASQNGMIAYLPGEGASGTNLVLYDRDGKVIGIVGERAIYNSPKFSPDGGKIVVDIFDNKTRANNIWVYDIQRGARTQITFDALNASDPIWSPDGQFIIYSKSKGRIENLNMKPSTGAGSEQILHQSTHQMIPTSWSPDGKYLTYFNRGEYDLWVLPFEVAEEPIPFLQSPAVLGSPALSPDGKWIAYDSNESGRSEIYVRPFPGPGGKWQISSAGGTRPRWRNDGREIFYFDYEGTIKSAEVSMKESTIEIESDRPLFTTKANIRFGTYDITSDGKLFVVNSVIKSYEDELITLIVNWNSNGRKK
jgi:eukaryotic-like serine/threonine-protein kinase